MDVMVRSCGAQRALVLLPGAQMHPGDVFQAGLVQALERSGQALDLHVPDLHIDPTGRFDAGQVLYDGLLGDLQARYRRVWLGGISLGGMLAVHQAQRYADGLAGLCLLAPYGGSRLTTNAIERAGGLQAWQPTDAQKADVEFQLWLALREGRPRLPAFVGYGRQDRFADTMAALAGHLPSASVHLVTGGHDWAAWLPLWDRFLHWLPTSQERSQ